MKYQDILKSRVGAGVIYFVKWTLISCLTGILGGAAGSVFGHGIRLAARAFQAYGWLLLMFPLAGVLIVWMYRAAHQEENRGTNMVLLAISSDERITLATAPLIFASTILTHLTGGSAGREGAALQLGGSIGSLVGRLVRLDEKDKKIGVICGMSGCFGALFGTPLAAAVFCMEVANVGAFYYAALIPGMFSSFIGAGIAGRAGLAAERFVIQKIPAFGVGPAVIIVILGILCAVVSVGCCQLLHGVENLYKKYIENPYLRVLAASGILWVLTLAVGTRVYNGSSMELIEEAMEGHVRYEAFLIKAVFTAVTLGAGYKGGEIVPTLCVGATFGCMIGTLFGFSPSLCAACGMVALFVGVTNCPLASMLIAFEMFGFDAMPYLVIAVTVSFGLSGYYGLYGSQKFAFSKLRMERKS